MKKDIFKVTTGIIIGILMSISGYLFYVNKYPDKDKIRIVNTIRKVKIYIPKIDTVIKYKFLVNNNLRIDTVEIINKDTVLIRDTVFIVNDYSNKRVYKDTIRASKSLNIAIIDTLQYNRIVSRRYFIDEPVLPVKRSFIVFSGINTNKDISIGAMYNWKRYSIGIEGSNKVFGIKAGIWIY